MRSRCQPTDHSPTPPHTQGLVQLSNANRHYSQTKPPHQKRKRAPVSSRQALRRWPDPVRNRSLVCDPGASPQIIPPPPLTRRGWYNSAMRIAITHKLSHRTRKGKEHLLAHVKPYDAGQIPFEIDLWFAIQVPAHRSFSHPPANPTEGAGHNAVAPSPAVCAHAQPCLHAPSPTYLTFTSACLPAPRNLPASYNLPTSYNLATSYNPVHLPSKACR